jgi:hypothetical protein
MRKGIFIILILLGAAVVFLPDIVKMSMHDLRMAHRKTTPAGKEYEGKGVAVYRNNNFNIYVFDAGASRFGVSTKRPEGKRFYMNANFFTPSADPIGLLIENGRKRSDATPGGGCFFVVGGRADLRRGACPPNATHASQTLLWAIDDGRVNQSLMTARHARVLTYRNLLGKNRNGDIVVIASRFGGVVNVRDVVDEAVSQGVVEGLLFDGGTSVEYSFDDGRYSSSFRSLTDLSKSILGIDRPVSYIYVE